MQILRLIKPFVKKKAAGGLRALSRDIGRLGGQYEEAITWCEKAILQEPNSFLARIMMAAVYSLSGTGGGSSG